MVKTSPEVKVEDFDIFTTAYMFYKPIVFRSTQKGVYYNGLVRLGVSTESIIREIQTAREGLLIRTTIIAALALGIGII